MSTTAKESCESIAGSVGHLDHPGPRVQARSSAVAVLPGAVPGLGPGYGVSPPISPPPDVATVQLHLAQQSRLARAVKRACDIACAACGLLIAAPLLLITMAIIALDSRGPVLYRQPRMGLGQRPFTIVKLRTMVPNGRVTRIGRFLRPLGIDELPQLWNVLKGDMSIVGPRPEVLDRVPQHDRDLPDYWARHLMRPGITGWAQVNGLRGAVSIADRLNFDLAYISGWNLWLDVRILWETTGAVWRDTRRALRS